MSELNEDQALALDRINAKWRRTPMTAVRRNYSELLLAWYDGGIPNRCPMCRMAQTDVGAHIEEHHNAHLAEVVHGFPQPTPGYVADMLDEGNY